MTDAYDPGELAELERRIDGWLASLASENDRVIAVDRDTEAIRWYVRMRGDDKEFTTMWFTLGQRTLRYETHVMPAPEENDAELFEHLLRRNDHVARRLVVSRRIETRLQIERHAEVSTPALQLNAMIITPRLWPGQDGDAAGLRHYRLKVIRLHNNAGMVATRYFHHTRPREVSPGRR